MITHCTKSRSPQSVLRTRTIAAFDENAATTFMKMNAI
jgi:hypothetical protein